MGFEVGLALMATQMVGNISNAQGAANANTAALELQEKQEKIAYEQKSLANYTQIQQVVDAQTAAATTRGYSLNSPSFKAIQIDTLQKGGKRQRNLNLEQQVTEASYEAEKANIQQRLSAQIFGSVIGGARDFIDYSQSVPTKPKKDPGIGRSLPGRKGRLPGLSYE